MIKETKRKSICLKLTAFFALTSLFSLTTRVNTTQAVTYRKNYQYYNTREDYPTRSPHTSRRKHTQQEIDKAWIMVPWSHGGHYYHNTLTREDRDTTPSCL